MHSTPLVDLVGLSSMIERKRNAIEIIQSMVASGVLEGPFAIAMTRAHSVELKIAEEQYSKEIATRRESMNKISPRLPERSENSRVYRARSGSYLIEIYAYTAKIQVEKAPKAHLEAFWDANKRRGPVLSRFSIPLAVIRVTHDNGVTSERSISAKTSMNGHGELYASSFGYRDRRSNRSVSRQGLASSLPLTANQAEELVTKAEIALSHEINSRNHRCG